MSARTKPRKPTAEEFRQRQLDIDLRSRGITWVDSQYDPFLSWALRELAGQGKGPSSGGRPFPRGDLPKLVAFVKAHPREGVREKARQHFQEYHLTETLFREAFQEDKRMPGRKSKS